MAENQEEMSPIEMKVARQLEVIQMFEFLFIFATFSCFQHQQYFSFVPPVLLWGPQPSKRQVSQRTTAA